MNSRRLLSAWAALCVLGGGLAPAGTRGPFEWAGLVVGEAEAQTWRDVGRLGKKTAVRPTFTEEDEGRMAQANAAKFDAEHEMWPDPLLETYLTGLVQRLVAVAEPRPFPYRVRVVNASTVNAFTFGGGLLYVHAGLIARMENEAQLAMVLAHEIAHVTERHVTKGIERAFGIQLLGDAAATTAARTGAMQGEALAQTYQFSMSAAISGHGRSQERDADRIGLEYLVKAGWDPREAPITFELLLQEHGDPPRLTTFFYGSHPNNVDRYNTLTELAKTTYADDLAARRLVVDTKEFKRATRRVVIAAGRLDYEQTRYGTARAMFEKAARVWEGDPEPHYYLGKLALETGVGEAAVDEAVAHLQKAIAAEAGYAPAHRELGLAYYRRGDRAEAVASLERYIEIAPKADDADRIKATIQELKRYSG